jgi:hypothetical protein
VICKNNGKVEVVEYIYMTKEQSEQKREDDESRLNFELGHILMFMFSSKKLLDLCMHSD